MLRNLKCIIHQRLQNKITTFLVNSFPNSIQQTSHQFYLKCKSTVSMSVSQKKPHLEDVTNDPLTMFIVLRSDLLKLDGWTSGSVIGQACHATAAVLHQYQQNPKVKEYLSEINLPNMRKVVYSVKNEGQLLKIQTKLKDLQLPHYSWIEKPENILTCIATVPLEKSKGRPLFKSCSLYSQ